MIVIYIPVEIWKDDGLGFRPGIPSIGTVETVALPTEKVEWSWSERIQGESK